MKREKKKEEELLQLKIKNEMLEKEVAEIREKVANLPNILQKENSNSGQDQLQQNQPVPPPRNHFTNSPSSTSWSMPSPATGQVPNFENTLPAQNFGSTLPSHNLGFMPAQNFGYNTAQSFGNLPPQNFGNLPPQNLGNMNPQNLGNMNPQHLGNMNPQNFRFIPHNFNQQPSVMFSESNQRQMNTLLGPNLTRNHQNTPNFSSQQHNFRQNMNPPKFQRNFQNYNSNQRGYDESNTRKEKRGNLRPDDRRFEEIKSQPHNKDSKTFSNNKTENERPLFQKTERNNRSRSQPRNRGPNDKRDPAEFFRTREPNDKSDPAEFSSKENQSSNNEGNVVPTGKQPLNKEGFSHGHRGGRFNSRNRGPNDRREKKDVTNENQKFGGTKSQVEPTSEEISSEKLMRNKEAGFQGHRGQPGNRNFNNRRANFKRNSGKPRHNIQRDDDTDSDDSGHACSSGQERGSHPNLSKFGSINISCNSSGNQMPDVVKNSGGVKSRKGGIAQNNVQSSRKESVEEVLSRDNLGPGNILKRFIGTEIPTLVEAICLNVNLNTKVQDVIMMSDPDIKNPVLETPKNLVDIVNFKMKFQNAKSILM